MVDPTPQLPVPWWKPATSDHRPISWGEVYVKVGSGLGGIAGLLVFTNSWAYAVGRFGWFLGLSLGWIPAVILAVMAGILVTVLWMPILVLVSIVWFRIANGLPIWPHF
jgi:hypothetical protein